MVEGSTNLYHTAARARTSLSGSTGITYDNSTGAISIDGTVATLTDTQTLTNKTINFEDNTAIIEYAVTVSNASGSNKYYLDGQLASTVQLIPGVTYRFDTSDSSTSGHPFALSETKDGSHNSGSSYTQGVTTNGSQGSSGSYLQIVIDGMTPNLYYYCTAHSGMGNDGMLRTKIQDTDDVSEGSNNLYYTDARAQAAITGSTGINVSSGAVSIDSTVVTESSTDTLTNKTINFENNTAIIEFAVTVANSGSGNKYYFDGEESASIQLIPGITYRFDLSDGSTSGHPLALSTTKDGTHASGSSYTTGVTSNGSQGSSGAYLQIVVDAATADSLYYYCTAHSGMGGNGVISVQGLSLADSTTDDLSEGSTNLYYTTARWDTKMASADTDDLSEGSTNLYYTDTRVGSYLTTNTYATQSYVNTQVSNLVDSAPGTLDTLNELAAALGDDADFSTTVTNSIATKLASADFNSTFDTQLATKDTDDISEGSTNLYYTNARFDTQLGTKDTDDLTEGSTNLYYTDARADARIAAASLGDLSDVTDNASSFGEILRYTGSSWSTSDQLTGISKLNLLSTDAMLSSTNKDVVFRVNPTSATTGDFVDLTFESDGNSTGIVEFAQITVDAVNIDDNGGNAEGAIKFKVAKDAALDEIAQITKDGILLRDGKTLTFEGATDDAFETTLTVTDPTADRTITFKDATGTVALTSDIPSDTDGLTEGSSNLYYTDARADARIALADLQDLANVGFSTPGANENQKVVSWDNSAGTFVLSSVSGLSGSGETNTASNVGTAGVGVFKQKAGEDLEFKKINAGSAKITITDDTSNNEVDIDFGTVSIDDLSDVDTTSSAPSSGQALKWSGSTWEPGDASSQVAQLTDVTLTSLASGEFLTI